MEKARKYYKYGVWKIYPVRYSKKDFESAPRLVHRIEEIKKKLRILE